MVNAMMQINNLLSRRNEKKNMEKHNFIIFNISYKKTNIQHVLAVA